MAVLSAGVKVYWGTLGTPTATDWEKIPDIISFPNFYGSRDSIETTTIDIEPEGSKEYILGLNDPGGTLEIGVNFTTEVIETSAAMMSAQSGASGEELYLKVEYPTIGYGFIIPAIVQDVQPGETTPNTALTGVLPFAARGQVVRYKLTTP